MAVRFRKLRIKVADIVDFGIASGVLKLLAGTNISLAPASGIGTVTVSVLGPIAVAVPWTLVTPGDNLNVGDYEVDTGRFITGNKSVTSGYWMRSSSSAILYKMAIFQDIGPLSQVSLGDPTIPLAFNATYFSASSPWRGFRLDTDANVTGTASSFVLRGRNNPAGLGSIEFVSSQAVKAYRPLLSWLISDLNPTAIAEPQLNFTSPLGTLSINTVDAAPQVNVTLDFANPIPTAVVITPTANVIPLTIKGFATATVDVLDIYDAASPQNLIYQFRSSGELRVHLFSTNASPAIFRFIQGLVIDQTFLSRNSAGTVQLGLSSDLPAIIWAVAGDTWTFNTTFVKNNIFKALNTDTYLDASAAANLNFGVATRLLSIFANNTLVGSKARINDTTTNPTRTFEVLGAIAAKVNTQTVDYVIALSDFIVYGDATAAAITLTLPSSASAGANTVGMLLHIKKKDASANAVTIAAAGADTIQGVASVALAAQYNSRTLWTDGGGTWLVLAST